MASEQKRTIAIILSFLSSAALIVACIGKEWLANPEGSGTRIGLLSSTRCYQGKCEETSNSKLIDRLTEDGKLVVERNKMLPANLQVNVRPPWGGFPVVALITIITAILSAGGLITGAILALLRKRPDVAIMPTTIAILGLALMIINGCLVVATKPQMLSLGLDMIEDVSVAWTFWSFGAGAVLGLAAVFPLNRQIRPIDEELGAASATMSWAGSRDDQ